MGSSYCQEDNCMPLKNLLSWTKVRVHWNRYTILSTIIMTYKSIEVCHHYFLKDTNWMTVRNYPFFKWQGISSPLRRLVLLPSHPQNFDRTRLYEYHDGCLIRSRTWELFTLPSHLGSLLLLVVTIFLILLVFCVVCFVLSSLCVLCPIMSMSLDCSFFITTHPPLGFFFVRLFFLHVCCVY